METVRFGLIGYGHRGAQHAAAITRTAGARLVGVAVPSTERQATARVAHPQASVYTDYRELLDRDDIDIVCVAVPNSLHFAVGTNVLRAGKHLLLEKPLALNAADCDRLLALSRKQRRLLAIGHQFRVSSLWGGLRRIIEEGVIGRPLYAFLELARAPYRLGSGGWRYDPERVGSWLFEDSVHLFDLARWCLGDRGEPLSVYARGNTRDPAHPELQDNFSCLVNFPDHAHAVVAHTLAAFGYHLTAKVAGTRGAAWASSSAADPRDPNPTCSLLYGIGADVHPWPLATPAGEMTELTEEIALLARCVREEIPPPCSGEDGRWSTLLGLAARESAASGDEVSLAEFVARPDNLES